MIHKDDLMPALLAACPSFVPVWEAFREEWEDAANALPLYIVLGDFARHLIALLECGETAALRAAFEAIERLQVEGDDYVREAATVGILEDLQNDSLHHTTRPGQFVAYLGPVTERGWERLRRFWETGELLSDEDMG
jgi:hypothetical protein